MEIIEGVLREGGTFGGYGGREVWREGGIWRLWREVWREEGYRGGGMYGERNVWREVWREGGMDGGRLWRERRTGRYGGRGL